MGAAGSLVRTLAPVAVPIAATALVAGTGGAAAPVLAPALASGAGFGAMGMGAAGGASLLTGTNVALGASALGTAASTYGEYRAAADQSAVERYNAKVADADAKYVDRNTAAEMEMKTREVRRLQARQRALFAKSGFTEGGSLADIAADTGQAGMLDALTIKYGGQMQADKLRNKGALMRTRSGATKDAGYISAGTSLLAGAASSAPYWTRR